MNDWEAYNKRFHEEGVASFGVICREDYEDSLKAGHTLTCDDCYELSDAFGKLHNLIGDEKNIEEAVVAQRMLKRSRR